MFIDTDQPDAQTLPGPLSSLEVRDPRQTPRAEPQGPGAEPLALRGARPAPERDVPAHMYDPIRQVAVDQHGRPLAPTLAKDWTTIEGTHTDGDGGDNELWDWEEIR